MANVDYEYVFVFLRSVCHFRLIFCFCVLNLHTASYTVHTIMTVTRTCIFKFSSL
jgi:hypothetical protein